MTISLYTIWVVISILVIVCPFCVPLIPVFWELMMWLEGAFNLLCAGIYLPVVIGLFKNKGGEE